VSCDLTSPSDVTAVCGVPLSASLTELARSSGVKKFGGSGPPDLGCSAASGYPAKPGGSKNVKLSGVAVIFANGCQSRNLGVEVHTVNRSGGVDDGSPGPIVGSAITTPADCKATGIATDIPSCGTRYECTYTYAGVPTETELLIKTSGAAWATVYEYNVYIANDAVKNGAFSHDVQALGHDDYNVFAQAALGGGITQGNGVVLGEVHDCADVRLLNATAGVDRAKKVFAYFTDNEAQPLPDVAAQATGKLGLFGALDLAPGSVGVAAAGLSNGKLTTVGFTRASVFPDAVTLVTFHGPLPMQIP